MCATYCTDHSIHFSQFDTLFIRNICALTSFPFRVDADVSRAGNWLFDPSQPSQRVLNMYGQDAETFGSEIGKSIAQRIQQAYVSKQDPDYNFQFSSPSASTSLATSPTSSDQTDGYTSPVQFPSTVSTSSTNWPSTHPPEELPTLQQAYQQPQQQYSSYGPLSTHSMTTPQISPIQTQSSAGFGALPGLLPPSNGQQGCAWCGGGYRDKRNGGDDVGKEQEKKVHKV
uniref:Uncharacterized protein n=1 Tax=Caenorhabditis japonica TaxID=281687 RepID=A0A8R1EIK1_CAEJA